MSDAHGSDGKAANVERLREIEGLVPNHGISVDTFQFMYPTLTDLTDSAKGQKQVDMTILQLLVWYHSSIKLEFDARNWQVEAYKREVEAIKVQLSEKDDAYKREVEAYKREVEAIKGQLEEKDQRLKEKDQRLQKVENESSDVLTALRDLAKKDITLHQKRGSVTRSEAWHSLESKGFVKATSRISKQDSLDAEQLSTAFASIKTDAWTDEADMYPDVIKALKSSLYSPPSAINVVDTSKLREFPADVSIADYPDERLPYCVRYFIEFKFPPGNLICPGNCGQMVDYFDILHGRQPDRSAFVAILSNFDTAWVFEAEYRGESVSIYRKTAPTLADAVIHVDQQSRQQYQPVPSINEIFSSNYNFIDISKNHILLSVPCPTSGSTGMQTKSRKLAKEKGWRYPVRFEQGDDRFVLKMARGHLDVSNEIRILTKIRDAKCKHLPELVWSPPAEDKEFGIVPVGEAIDFQQHANIARRVVEGMVDGLQYLHSQGIIHRDIRPSNLIMHHTDVVIVDFETSVLIDRKTKVMYEGGRICWPKRLLESNMDYYVPEPADDLLACILVVLHLLFPSRFDRFHMGSISIRTSPTLETKQLIQLWKDIEDSKIWGPFVNAAKMTKYDELKGMADVFCSV